jgi:hypothetical protein
MVRMKTTRTAGVCDKPEEETTSKGPRGLVQCKTKRRSRAEGWLELSPARYQSDGMKYN